MNANTGSKVPPLSVEETVPYDHWLSWLKNLAFDCIHQFHLSKKSGYKHDALAMWEIIILSALLALSFDEAANRLNDILWKEWTAHQRRKNGPKQFKGKVVRRERLCPNGDQVRKYRNSLPNYLLENLNRTIFDMQLHYAEEHLLISKKIVILVDDTQQWYYGKDRYPQNPFITKMGYQDLSCV
jgi:hypothetical protein